MPSLSAGSVFREIAGGYKMATKAEHHEAVRAFVKKLTPPLKLSLPALETLAVIAYKQPVTTPEIMDIRGVQGAGVLKTLLDRKLIAEAGRKDVVGRPLTYKTTKEFPGPVRAEGFEGAADAQGIRGAGTPGTGGRIIARDGPRRSPGGQMPEERLQKILSQAGIASRRKAEELIQAGRVIGERRR